MSTEHIGAIRAGKQISERFRRALPYLPESNALTLADIIDKETRCSDMLKALKFFAANALSDQESLLCFVAVNGPAMKNPNNENSRKLRERCDRIKKAFDMAEELIAAFRPDEAERK